MKKTKKLIFLLVFLISSFFSIPPDFPENSQFQEILDFTSSKEVIIIFNSGGWGNTPLEEAKDFTPIVEGIQKTLDGWGLNVIVIPYKRTKDTFLGKIVGAKDFLSSFKFSSTALAEDLEFLTEKLPDKKIIITGLSAGGALVNKTMEKISPKTQVYAITTGIPFWIKSLKSENILQLNNNGRDSLAKGDVKSLLLTLIKTPFKWIFSKINGQNLSFSQAIQVPGHQYYWSEISPQIITFLENKLK